MLVLTFAPCALTFAPCALTFAPCALTFAPCTFGVILLSTMTVTTTMCASGVLAHMVVVIVMVDRITPKVQGAKVRAQGAKVRTSICASW